MPKHVFILDPTDDGPRLATGLTSPDWVTHHASTVFFTRDAAARQALDALIIRFRLADERGDAVAFGLTSMQPQLERATMLLVDNEADARLASATNYEIAMAPIDIDAIVSWLNQTPTASARGSGSRRSPGR